jgi:murein DD-endopeptidase
VKRAAFLARARRLEGLPYVWAADGPHAFDCSGLVCYCLAEVGGPDWRATHRCQTLWEALPPTREPQPGDLALYGTPGHATHVMLVVGDGRVYGACGGDSTTTSPELALQRGARVRYRLKVEYRHGRDGRSDFLGYRSLSQHLDV